MGGKRASSTPESKKVFGSYGNNRKCFAPGLYARVSTYDQQTLPMQNRAMREYAARRGWTIAMQVVKWALGPRGDKLARNCCKLRDAARST